MAIEVNCPSCSKRLRAPDTAAGKRVRCPQCQTAVAVPPPAAPPPAAGVGDLLDEYAASDQAQQQAQQQEMLQRREEFHAQRRLEIKKAAAQPKPRPATESSDSEGSGFPTGWVVFFLIFGVGNVILYLTTGWIIIPAK